MQTQTNAQRLARNYETIFIMRSSVNSEEANQVAQRVSDIVERKNGTLVRLDNWGRQRLAYPIEKSPRGLLVYLQYRGHGDVVQELERNLRLIDSVVRYQTVRIEDPEAGGTEQPEAKGTEPEAGGTEQPEGEQAVSKTPFDDLGEDQESETSYEDRLGFRARDRDDRHRRDYDSESDDDSSDDDSDSNDNQDEN